MERNPSLVQRAPPSRNPASPPLFLIHDGGGTTFSYHCMPSLQRTVYAIHNPRFYSGRAWAGGIATMAKAYANLIQMVVPSGKILLGGWSLGGLIALEIASVLGQISALQVVGIVMIDSVFPDAIKSRGQGDIVPHAPIISAHCRPEIRMLVANMMKASSAMVEQWVMPTWAPPCPRRRGLSILGTRQPTDSGYASSNESDNDALPDRVLLASLLPQPPPTILLRCGELVPVPKSENVNAISRVDAARQEKLLGWGQYDYDLICAVLDVPGHHFNLFSEPHIKQTGAQIMEACDLLERLDCATSDIPQALDVDVF